MTNNTNIACGSDHENRFLVDSVVKVLNLWKIMLHMQCLINTGDIFKALNINGEVIADAC